MPSGSFSGFPLPPGHTGIQSGVFRYVPAHEDAEGDPVEAQLTPLPLVRWVDITDYRGPQPARASFRYAFPPDESAPVLFEHFLPVASDETSAPADLLKLDDRIVVIALTPEGQPRYLFDGFVQIPEGSIEGSAYGLPFQAQGVPIRCWDDPLKGSERRSVFTPSNFLLDRQTDLPARLNPDGKANCTGDPDDDGSWDHETDENDLGHKFKYPVFFDELYPDDSPLHADADKPYVRKFTLTLAARYILAKANGKEEYVENPNFEALGDLLAAAIPSSGEIIDPTDPDTFTYEPIFCADTVISGRPWPEVLYELIAPHGFSFCFRLETGSDGFPRHRLEVFRERDNIGAIYKDLNLQARGENLDISQTNVAGFRMARDATQVINEYTVDGGMFEHEIGIVLAPLFSIVSTDVDTPEQWRTSNVDPNADRKKYRLFGADETGEGHWAFASNTFLSGIGASFDFSPLFGAEKWIVRRRPPGGELFSRDAEGNQRRAFIGLLTRWSKTPPALWGGDGDGEFRPLKTSFRMLRDRLGIQLTCGDPSKLAIGDVSDDDATLAASEIDLVQRLVGTLTDPDPLNRVHFVLFCTVQADESVSPRAPRRASSPTRFVVRRHVEAEDRYKRQVVNRSSFYFKSLSVGVLDSTPEYKTMREDTATAMRYAIAKQSATDLPSFGGSVAIPRIVNLYQVGDRIKRIDGRMSLQTNVNTEHDEGPRYPSVVARTWQNEPGQQTILQLDDRRAEGEPIEA